MAEYLPPTEDVAIFDTLNFNDGDTPLTYNKAVKYFLRYPIAQGTETLQTTNVNGLLTANAGIVTDTITASAIGAQTRLFNEGVSGTPQTATTEICNGARAGSATVIINTSSSSSAPTVIGGGGSCSFISKGNLTLTGSTTNTTAVATTTTEGPINIATSQTSGKFALGGASRTRVDGTKSGEVFIFNGTSTGIDAANRADITFGPGSGTSSFARLNIYNGSRTNSSTIRIGDGIGDTTSGISINSGGATGVPNLSTTTINGGIENQGSVSICGTQYNTGETAINNGSDNGKKADGTPLGGNVRIASGNNNRGAVNILNGIDNIGTCSFMNGANNTALLYLQAGQWNSGSTQFHNGSNNGQRADGTRTGGAITALGGTNNCGSFNVCGGANNGETALIVGPPQVDPIIAGGNCTFNNGANNCGNFQVMTGANNGTNSSGGSGNTSWSIGTGANNRATGSIMTGQYNGGSLSIMNGTNNGTRSDGLTTLGGLLNIQTGQYNIGNIDIMTGTNNGTKQGDLSTVGGTIRMLTGTSNKGSISFLTGASNTGDFNLGAPIKPSYLGTKATSLGNLYIGYQISESVIVSVPQNTVTQVEFLSLPSGVWQLEGSMVFPVGTTSQDKTLGLSTTALTFDNSRSISTNQGEGILQLSSVFCLGATTTVHLLLSSKNHAITNGTAYIRATRLS